MKSSRTDNNNRKSCKSYEYDRSAQLSGESFHAFVMDKRTLATAILNFDGDGTKLGIVSPQYGDGMFEFGSTEALLDAVDDLKQRYGDENYVWGWSRRTDMPGFVEGIANRGFPIKPHPQVLDLFTPRRQHEAIPGQKNIPCRKRVFFKGLGANAIIYCDETGRRIFRGFNPNATVREYYWIYDTDEELRLAYDDLRNEYLNDGYELTFDGTVDFSFDFRLKQCRKNICESGKNYIPL